MIPSVRKRRGTTLIETLIAVTVFLLLTTGALTILTLALKFNKTGDILTDLQRYTVVAEEKIITDLQESKSSFVTNNTSGLTPALAIPTPRDQAGTVHLNPDGTPDWQAYFIYYASTDASSGQKNLLRRRAEVKPVGPGFDPNPFLDGSGSVVAQFLSTFQATLGTAPNGALDATVTVGTTESFQSKNNSFSLTRMAFFANNN